MSGIVRLKGHRGLGGLQGAALIAVFHQKIGFVAKPRSFRSSIDLTSHPERRPAL